MSVIRQDAVSDAGRGSSESGPRRAGCIAAARNRAAKLCKVQSRGGQTGESKERDATKSEATTEASQMSVRWSVAPFQQCLIESAAARPKERRRSTAPRREITAEDARNSHVLRNILEASAKSKTDVGDRNLPLSPRWLHKEGYGEVRDAPIDRPIRRTCTRSASSRCQATCKCARWSWQPNAMQKNAPEKLRCALQVISNALHPRLRV